jgi:hypothetical protein
LALVYQDDAREEFQEEDLSSMRPQRHFSFCLNRQLFKATPSRHYYESISEFLVGNVAIS